MKRYAQNSGNALGIFAAFLIGIASLRAQSVVHHFTSIAARPEGTVSLELSGNTPAAFLNYFDLFPLETSNDLSNWTSLATIVRTNRATNALVYLDAALPASQRFYRTPTNDFLTALA